MAGCAFFSKIRKKPAHVTIVICITMTVMVLAAGCTTTPAPDNQTGGIPVLPSVSPIAEKSATFYKVTIPQVESTHPEYFKMDSDVYNQGEIIEFSVVNEGSGSLACDRFIPSLGFSLYRQVGTWELQPIGDSSRLQQGVHTDYGYYLQPGGSEPVRHLSTTDLVPGHYKIVTECGVSREFEIRAAPVPSS